MPAPTLLARARPAHRSALAALALMLIAGLPATPASAGPEGASTQDDAGSGRDAPSASEAPFLLGEGDFFGRLDPAAGDAEDHYLLQAPALSYGQWSISATRPVELRTDTRTLVSTQIGASWSAGIDQHTQRFVLAAIGGEAVEYTLSTSWEMRPDLTLTIVEERVGTEGAQLTTDGARELVVDVSNIGPGAGDPSWVKAQYQTRDGIRHLGSWRLDPLMPGATVRVVIPWEASGIVGEGRYLVRLDTSSFDHDRTNNADAMGNASGTDLLVRDPVLRSDGQRTYVGVKRDVSYPTVERWCDGRPPQPVCLVWHQTRIVAEASVRRDVQEPDPRPTCFASTVLGGFCRTA